MYESLANFYEMLYGKFNEGSKIKLIEKIRSADSIEEALPVFDRYLSIKYASRWIFYNHRERMATIKGLYLDLQWLGISTPHWTLAPTWKNKKSKTSEKQKEVN
jgi:hypothetical protein